MEESAISLLHLGLLLVMLHLIHITHSISDQNLGKAIRHLREQKIVGLRSEYFNDTMTDKMVQNNSHGNESLQGTLPHYNFILDRIPNIHHDGGVVGYLIKLQESSIARGLQVRDIKNLLAPLVESKENSSDLKTLVDFLTIPRLREILGPNFRLSDYRTNAELLWGILSHALDSKEIKNDLFLHEAIQNSLNNVQEIGEDFLVSDDKLFDRLRGIWIKKPRKALLDTLLHILCQYSNDPNKLDDLRQAFNRPKESILGPDFDLYKYSTLGELFEIILLHTLKPEEDDFDLFRTLKFYLGRNQEQNDKPQLALRTSLTTAPDAEVEFLLSALNECGKNDNKKSYIRELLKSKNLVEILGDDFDPSDIASNGALLRAILIQSLHSKQIRENRDLFDSILSYVNKIQLDGDACKPIDSDFYKRFINSREFYTNPHIDNALSVLNSYFEDAGKIPPIRDFLNKETLAHILGPNFNDSQQQTLGDLTNVILDKILSSKEVKGNLELYNAILYYTGLQETQKRSTSPGQERKFEYNIDKLLSVMKIRLNDTVVAPIRNILTSENINTILGSDFDPLQYQSNAKLLNAMLLKITNSSEFNNDKSLRAGVNILLERLRREEEIYPLLFRNSTNVSQRKFSGDVELLNVSALIESLRYYNDSEPKLKLVESLLNNSTKLSEILGSDYNPLIYNSTTLLLYNLFSVFVNSKTFANETEINEVLKFYLNKIKDDLNEERLSDNVYYEHVENTDRPTTIESDNEVVDDPDIDYLLEALEKYSDKNPEKTKQLRQFLNLPNFVKILGPNFSYSKHKSNEQLLKAILIQALKNEDIRKNEILYDALKYFNDTLIYASSVSEEGKIYPTVDFLLRALSVKNITKIELLHAFLRCPDLSDLLGPYFNPHYYHTNGQMLKAIIGYALNSSYINNDLDFLKGLQELEPAVIISGEGNWAIGPDFFYKLKTYIKVDSREISLYPNIDILLQALAPQVRNDSRIPYLFKFLTNPQLYIILGDEFNPYMYDTNGELLQAILHFALSSVDIQSDTFLQDILKYFLSGVIGEIPIDAVFFYQLQLRTIEDKNSDINKYPHIDMLLSALNRESRENPHLAYLFEFLLSPNKTEILGPIFHYNNFSTNGQLLQGILKHVAESRELQHNNNWHRAASYFANKVDLKESGNRTLEKGFYQKLKHITVDTYRIYPNVEYLLNALRTFYKQGPEYENLYKFLTKSNLHESLKPGFNYKKYRTNGELLQAMLTYAKPRFGDFRPFLQGLKDDEEGNLLLEPEFFRHLQRLENREYNPYMDYLLQSALGNDARPQIKQLRQFLSDPDLLLHLGGMSFDAYDTLGELMRAILRRAIHVGRVRDDQELYYVILRALNNIIKGGNSSSPSNYGPYDYPVTFDMNALILALDTDGMYRSNLGPAVSEIGNFLRDDFRPLSQLKDFPFEVFRIRGEFLKGLFNHLLALKSVSDVAKECLKQAMPYIRMSGPGSAPVDYVPFVIE